MGIVEIALLHYSWEENPLKQDCFVSIFLLDFLLKDLFTASFLASPNFQKGS
jgi:hypothetical protein